MSGDDISDLWTAINELRKGLAEVLTEVRALAAGLRERCESRADTLMDYGRRIAELEKNHGLMKIEQVRQGVYIALGASLLSSAITLFGTWLIKGAH